MYVPPTHSQHDEMEVGTTVVVVVIVVGGVEAEGALDITISTPFYPSLHPRRLRQNLPY